MTALAPAAEISDRQKLRPPQVPTEHRQGADGERAADAPVHPRRAPQTPHTDVRPAAPSQAATRHGPTTAPGDPTALCCAVAHAATEVLRGIRPIAQLVRSVSPEVYEQLEARLQVSTTARLRRGAPPTPQSRSRVRRARVVRVGQDAAEASVVVDDVDRVRAIALRVELHRGRWRAVVLEIG